MHNLLYQTTSASVTPTVRVREKGHKKSKTFVSDVSCGVLLQVFSWRAVLTCTRQELLKM